MKLGDDAGAGAAFASDPASGEGADHRDETVVDQADRKAPASGQTIPLRGGTLVEKIDNLHADMLGGTGLGHHTELWNLVHAFKERVKALVAETEHAV